MSAESMRRGAREANEESARAAQSGELKITLRDYFAAHALQGSLSCVELFSDELARSGKGHVALDEFMAKLAYNYADAMLKARAS